MRDYRCNKPLRSVQQEMLDAVFDDMNAGYKRLLCIAPMGCGKSAVMGGLSSHYLRVRPNAVVLVLSHLGLLIQQSGSSFKEFFNLDTGVLQAQTYPSPTDQCILSTVQSASIEEKINRFKDRLPIGRRVELILLDEAHRNSGVDQVDRIIDEFFPDAKVCGLTGSPFKSNKDMTSLFEKVSYSVSLREAIEMGYLVPPRIHGIGIDKKDLEDVMEKVTSSIIASHNRDKSVVFMKSIKEARIMAQALRDVGFKATVITSDVDDQVREQLLIKFRDNTPDSHQIFVTVDVLSVGFDAPHLKAIYMPYGTGSVSQYLQRLGRGLRTCPQIGKEYCDIYIGGPDPIIEQGKWERIQKHVETAGEDGQVDDMTIDEVERELDQLEGEELVQAEDNMVTIETANLMRKFKDGGLNNLAALVGDRDFPAEFLDHLVAVDTTTKVKSKQKATAKQVELIKGKGIDATNFSRTEASVTIDAIAKKEGWYKPKPIAPCGLYKGKELSDIPWKYRTMVTKPTSPHYNAELAKFFKENR